MIVRKLRLQRSWSQEQLSELSGLSVRTIQRIERGQKAGLESMKSLAVVFEIQVDELQPETEMTQDTLEEENALKYVKDIKDFYTHLIIYGVVILYMFFAHVMSSPDDYTGVIVVAVAWGAGVLMNGLLVFEVFSLYTPAWEGKQVEKRLKRKL